MGKLDLVAYLKMEGSKVGIRIENNLRKDQLLTANIDLDNLDEYISSFNEVMAKVKALLPNEN